MGKMGEVAAQLSELKHCGEILIGISDTLTELFSGEPENGKESAGRDTCKERSCEKGAAKAEPEVKAPDAGGSPCGAGGEVPRRTHGKGQGTA